MAIFVEGQTEALFVRDLVQEFAGRRGLTLVEQTQFGGQLHQTYSEVAENAEFEVLIANCCSDGAVGTQIRDRYTHLVASGYDLIIGLRDLYPMTHAELPLLQAGVASAMPNGPIPICFEIAVAEVEAWFIEEITHFQRVDPNLTDHAIKAATGLDLSLRSAEKLIWPAMSLHDAYQVVGKSWKKSRRQVERLLAALDVDYLYNDSRLHSKSLDSFISNLESFMA